MTTLKDFEHYKQKNIVYKIRPDKNKAQNLQNKARIQKTFLQETQKHIPNLDRYNHIIVELTYSSLIKLARSHLYLKGYKTKGEGSHQAQIAFLELEGISKKHMNNLNQLRKIRNKIKYTEKHANHTTTEVITQFKQIYKTLNQNLTQQLT